MKQYIDKAALVAEIEKRQRILDLENPLGRGGMVELQVLKDKINTLEVKEVECGDVQPMSEVVKIGETEIYFEDDGGEPPYDGKQWLDLGCIEHEIPTDKFNDGDIVEILIRKIGTKQIEL